MKKILAAFIGLLLSQAALAAFPPIASSNSGELGSGASGIAVMPATVEADHLLFLCVAVDGDEDTSVAGWQEEYDLLSSTSAVSGACFTLDADGTEDGDNVVVDWGPDTQNGSYIVVAIDDTFDGTSASLSCTAQGFSSSNTHNPPAHNPTGWDVEDTLWIALTQYDFTHTVNTWPLPNDQLRVTHTGGGGASMGFATQNSAAASLDPGTFSMSGGSSHVATTCAVRPAAPPAAEDTWFFWRKR